MSDPVVVVTETLAPEASRWLEERCDVRTIRHDRAGFDAALADASGLVVRTYTTVDGGLLDRAPRLRVVGRAGAGIENIDVAACRSRNIEVVYTPDANTQAVVEYVFARILDAIRPGDAVRAATDLDGWQALRDAAVAERQLDERVLGILGMGRIGRRVARAAAGLGVRTQYHDLVEIPADERAGATPVDSETLFSTSDVITVHVDGRPGNRRLVGPASIDRMRPDVILVNTSRGFVVDNVALAAFLRRHPAARAILDVHDPEPIDAASPLLGLPGAYLSPHVAGRTRRALAGMSEVVRDVVAVLEGRAPRHPAAR
jgi:D-3-phosphoglycerate dehydrogenase